MQLLATGTGARRAVREAARQLLKRYPLDVDLEVSAAALPGIWASRKMIAISDAECRLLK
ncbi:hypothetical protein WN982_19350 [Paraburkholderia sp. IMGN_8]|uniref:hypothetical protein n=1 Tax=Paraburkholderia sp. IMGN_8 TaxID=3136564 RepID=UPI003100F756